MQSMRAAQEGIDDLISAAMEDRSLSARLTEAMGSSWIPMLCAAAGALGDSAVRIEFELRYPDGVHEAGVQRARSKSERRSDQWLTEVHRAGDSRRASTGWSVCSAGRGRIGWREVSSG